MTGFVQTFKCFFPGFAKTKFQGFSGLENPFSRTFQETFHSKHWLHEFKNAYTKSVIGVRVSALKYRSGNANNISNNRFDPRGGTVLKSIAYAYLLSDYSK